jgi:transposase
VLLPRQQAKLAGGTKDKEHAMSQTPNCALASACANIPPKRNRKGPICFSPYLYRARNLIEQFFNKIKQYRRVATRYDGLAANYLAFI